jgi:UTP--glucose-1-phosphate uridylyltransferase
VKVRTAVIPAAGLGTRFLPLTKAVPKELLPLGEVPALQLVIDEAVGAGVEHVVIVTNRAKPALETYLEPDPALVERLAAGGREELASRLGRLGTSVRVSFVVQDAPLGLGHAVGCAREAVGDEPFAVLLPDEIMGSPSLLDRMARLAEHTGGSVVALKQVARSEVSAYGVVDPEGDIVDGVVAIADVVEKPSVESAPSELIIIGRYVIAADVFDHIAALRPGAGGELQLTDALRTLAATSPFHGVVSDVRRHDTGTPLGWLCAVVELALEHPDHGAAFGTWLSSFVERR